MEENQLSHHTFDRRRFTLGKGWVYDGKRNMIMKDQVVEGRGRGRTLGYPTANLAHRHKISSGVWQAEISIQKKSYPGFLIVGAFRKKDRTLAEEVHLLNFTGNLYDKTITVHIRKKLRKMKKFKNDRELKKQIKKDIERLKKSLCSRA